MKIDIINLLDDSRLVFVQIIYFHVAYAINGTYVQSSSNLLAIISGRLSLQERLTHVAINLFLVFQVAAQPS